MAIALSASGCTEFTRPSIADGRVAGSICSQLNIELARIEGLRHQEESVIHYIYYMTVALLPKVFKLTSRPAFTCCLQSSGRTTELSRPIMSSDVSLLTLLLQCFVGPY